MLKEFIPILPALFTPCAFLSRSERETIFLAATGRQALLEVRRARQRPPQ